MKKRKVPRCGNLFITSPLFRRLIAIHRELSRNWENELQLLFSFPNWSLIVDAQRYIIIGRKWSGAINLTTISITWVARTLYVIGYDRKKIDFAWQAARAVIVID